jgi:hypothetical protein
VSGLEELDGVAGRIVEQDVVPEGGRRALAGLPSWMAASTSSIM